jgi:hypothetical protein
MLLCAQPALAKDPTPIGGAWVVNLTLPPGSKPYLKAMTITPATDGTIKGDFYDSDMQAGRWTEQRNFLFLWKATRKTP